MSDAEQALLLQLLDPANRADPYPVYTQFRDRGPVQLPEANLIPTGAWARPVEPPGFLFLDPPTHTRLRKLVSKALVPKVINELRPDITALVDGLLDQVADRGRFDVIGEFAHPLPWR